MAGLDGVFARAMAKQPSRRFGSCGEFVAVLSEQLRGGASPYIYEAQPYTFETGRPALPAPKRSGRRAGILIGALITVALLIGAGVFAAVKLSQPNNPAAPGPFGGTYRADFGPFVDLDAPTDTVAPQSALTGSYGLRSTCRSTCLTSSRVPAPVRKTMTSICPVIRRLAKSMAS